MSTFEKLLGGEEAIEFGPPKTGSYEEPDPPNLPLVNEKMELTICVSPEAGWGEIREIYRRDRKVADGRHVPIHGAAYFRSRQCKAVTPAGREFELVLHPIPEKPPKSGVKANDLDEQEQVIAPLAQNLKGRFDMAWATLKSNAHPDGLWASAYHIKVAVRDGRAVWLLERQLAIVQPIGCSSIRGQAR